MSFVVEMDVGEIEQNMTEGKQEKQDYAFNIYLVLDLVLLKSSIQNFRIKGELVLCSFNKLGGGNTNTERN